ncbi:MAG: anaerobic ribonucleoside-triphosphate reductase activating protein [Lachnospiraceae bacterium]|nr:anaerobic ribonucleoside-triphosphate reductase activating protein [Lachnospiraceae bacterium]
MYYGNIKRCDVANGRGVRTSLFVSGCTHCCEGCFNPETWDFKYGQEYTEETKNKLLEECKPPYIAGLTILGGEPLEPANQRALVPLLKEFKELYPQKDIWIYTGYTYETDVKAPSGKVHTEVTDELLSYVDILVDGEFIMDKKNVGLHFRGSENQHVINVKTGEYLYTEDLEEKKGNGDD